MTQSRLKKVIITFTVLSVATFMNEREDETDKQCSRPKRCRRMAATADDFLFKRLKAASHLSLCCCFFYRKEC